MSVGILAGIYPVMGGYSHEEVVTISHTGGKGVGRGNYHCDASDWLQVQATMLLYDLLCMIMLLVLVGAGGCYHHAQPDIPPTSCR